MSAMVMRHCLRAVLPASLTVLTLAMEMAPPRVWRGPVLFPGARQALAARRRRAPGRAIQAPPVAPPAQEKRVAAPRAPVASAGRERGVGYVSSGKARCKLSGCLPLMPLAHIAPGTPCTGSTSAAVASPGSIPWHRSPEPRLRRRGSRSRRQYPAPFVLPRITFPPPPGSRPGRR
jgi:hypothetical protein